MEGMSVTLSADPFQVLTEDVLAELAVSRGACVRPVMAQVHDRLEGTEHGVAIHCESFEGSNPSAAT